VTASAPTSSRGAHLCKRVACYNAQGRKVAEYPSLAAAALATGADGTNIGFATRRRQRRVAGFYWRVSDGNAPDTTDTPPQYLKGTSRAVVQYDTAGNKLAEFRSVGLAARATGVSRSNIHKAVRGLSHTAGGSVWMLADSDTHLFNEFHRTGDIAARNKLVERYHHLVTFQAERIHPKLPKCVQVEDLIAAGTFGLIEALKRFNPGRNVKFSTYAPRRIYGAIMDSLRCEDWVPRLARHRTRIVHEAQDTFQTEHGRQPTTDELAAALNLSGAEFNRVKDDAREVTVASLELVAGTHENRGEPVTLSKSLVDSRAPAPDSDPHHTDLRDVLLEQFNLTRALLVRMYYVDELTMREIGEALGISESRISQLHSQTLAALRGRYGDRLFELLLGRAA
jgi:RNA polymerase sigma factor for flagellar operon FliA